LVNQQLHLMLDIVVRRFHLWNPTGMHLSIGYPILGTPHGLAQFLCVVHQFSAEHNSIASYFQLVCMLFEFGHRTAHEHRRSDITPGINGLKLVIYMGTFIRA
jgi:hypothetical protein